MTLGRLLLIPTAALTLTSVLSAQSAKSTPAPRPPQLTLEIIPAKKTYFVGETLFVKYKLTSLVDGTLCFAQPAVEQTGGFGGYLKTDVTSPQGEDLDFFIDHVWPMHPTQEEIRRDVANRWIRLGMSEPYTPKAKARITVLSGPGEWVLKSTYYPPELKSGEKPIVESLGCSPADVEVHSAPVTITVMNAPK